MPLKQSLAVCLFLLLIVRVPAQCDQTYFRNLNNSINDIAWLGNDKLLAVGNSGSIIKSYDRGKNWRFITTHTAATSLNAIQMVSDSIGYVVGSNQALLKTEDEGESWMAITPGMPPGFSPYTNLYQLFFMDKDRGWIVGDKGLVSYTADGGKSWRYQLLGTNAASLRSVCFINDSIGFISGQYDLYKTTDAGNTWVKQSISNNFTPYYKVKFFGGLTGYLLGSNGALKTTDAGNTWQTTSMASGQLLDIHFYDAMHGFVLAGDIRETTDGGVTWLPVWLTKPNYIAASYTCFAYDAGSQETFLAGRASNGGRVVVRSPGQLQSFTACSYSHGGNYYALQVQDHSTIYTGGDQFNLLKSNDGGESWKPMKKVPAGNNKPLNGLFFVDSLHGFASTDSLFKTTDGGQTWQSLSSPEPGFSIATPFMYFYDSLKGIAASADKIYATSDAGSSWTTILDEASLVFNNVSALPSGKIVASLGEGKIALSADTGHTWSTHQLHSASYITKVYFYNDSVGFIGTIDGYQYKTTDGGLSWSRTTASISNQRIRSFWFSSPVQGYMVDGTYSSYSGVYVTNNGGTSWTLVKEIQGQVNNIAGIQAPILVGANGLIMRLDTLQAPGMPADISATGRICIDAKMLVKTGQLSGVDYHWSFTGGGWQSPNQHTDTLLIQQPGQYILSLYLSNACGAGPVRTANLASVDFKPVIIQRDSILTATEGQAYQWYRYVIPVPAAEGGNQRRYVPTLQDDYTVSVTKFEGCTITTAPVNYANGKWLCAGATDSISATFNSSSYLWFMNDGTGDNWTLNFNDPYITGWQSKTLRFSNLPSTYNGYKFLCQGNATITQLRFSNTWTGAADQHWENAANWSCSQVPDENSSVSILSGTVIISSNVTVKQLFVESNAQLSVQPGNTLTITR